MKTIIIQNQVCRKIDETLDRIDATLASTNMSNTDFIILPEMFTTPYEHACFKEYKQTEEGPVFNFIKHLAKRYGCYVIGGSMPFSDEGRIYNSCFIFNREGELIDRYDKIHLFEITYPNGDTFREKDVLTKGDRIVVFDTEFGKMGVMICFDVRFPELADKIARAGAKVIFVPAAFNDFTGPLHWETTFKARAIDNQLFMIGCSPSNTSYGNYSTYGHSILVNPMGKVVAELNGQCDIMVEDIDLTEVSSAREVLPIFKNKSQ